MGMLLHPVTVPSSTWCHMLSIRSYTFFAGGRSGGFHLRRLVSTSMPRAELSVLRCSSMMRGVTLMMWSPFQYLMRFSDSSVLMMSSVRTAVKSDMSW